MTNRRSPAWHLFIVMIGAIALLGLVAAAACNDDDDDGNGNGDPTATTSDGGGGGFGDGVSDGDGDGSSLADLANFGDDYESFTGKITYNITGFTAEG
ncbi:MAG: hypothetical protein IIA90_04175, partial [Chloroflexi bacterium]|nr:hypothetical protein [Chloroflexota bacterium]